MLERKGRLVRALLIDMDGTMVDSLPYWYAVYCAILENFDQKGTPEEFEKINGPTIREVMGILHERYQLPGNPEGLLDLYKEKALARLGDLRLFPGVPESLEKAKGLGLKLCVVTSSERKVTDVVLGQCGVLQFFDEICTGDEVERSKPDPAIYNLALERCEVEADEALVIEDAPAGLASAKAAGIEALHYQADSWHGIHEELFGEALSESHSH